MKKVLKVIGVLALACVMAAGGYMAGQKVQISSVISAMPKRTIEKPMESKEPDASEAPAEEPPMRSEKIPMSEEETRVIAKTDKSAVDDSWSVVENTSNTTDNGALTLYTSAQKEGGEFIWDDSQKWVVEMSDGNGGYYTLYDQLVSNGSVYYDIVQKENGDKIINVYTMSGAGTTIKQYTRSDTGYTEKTVYNSGVVNRLFSTVPEYR
ncbi:MAG: hypothetical protein ACI4A5_06790 [Hominilimicola sp.]